MLCRISAEDGQLLSALIEIDGSDLVLHSRGSNNGKPVNPDYSVALRLILSRLRAAMVDISGAWVDSDRVRGLSDSAKAILGPDDAQASPAELFTRMTSRMQRVGRSPASSSKGGNPSKRILIQVSPSMTSQQLAATLQAIPERSTSLDRLPATDLQKVTAEHVWNAVQKLLGGYADHAYGDSIDYDIIANGGVRLPPKAVFGIAASEALGFEVLPRHFTAGTNSPCFRILAASGFAVVSKVLERSRTTQQPEPIIQEAEAQDMEYREGTLKLRQHLSRERAPGLRQGKIAKFRRDNGGLLFCERCRFNPVERYLAEVADACIEVHHRSVQVQNMADGHSTKLDDLQCLCANCHRVVHRELARRAVVSGVR